MIVRRLTQREKLIMLVTVLLGSIVGLYYGLWQPWQTERLDLNTAILAHQRKLQKNLTLINETRSRVQLLEAELKSFVPTKSDEQIRSLVLSEIEAVAAELSIAISNLKTMPVQKENYEQRFPVSLLMESSLVDVAHFLYRLQSEPHFFNIEEARFDKSPSQQPGTLLKTQLIVSKVFVNIPK